MLKDKIINLFYIVFLAMYGLVTFNTIFNNFHYDYKWYIVLPVAFIWLGVIFLIYKLLAKHENWLEENTLKGFLIFFVFLIISQLLDFYFFGAYPSVDLVPVYQGAYDYTISGQIVDPTLDYFYKYPNNMPLAIILQFIFRVFYKFGFTEFYYIGVISNAIMLQLTYIFLFLLVKELVNTKFAFFSIILLMFCLPLHTYIAIYYTDTFSMMFPLAGLYFFVKLMKSKETKYMILNTILLSFFIGFGTKIKYSVIIAFVALVIVLVLNSEIKKLVAVAISFTVIYSAVVFSFNSFMYNNILDEELAYDLKTPMLNWVAMSLVGDGSHNTETNYYIWARDTQEEKQEAAIELITLRLEEKGFFGYLEFLNQKAITSFGSGEFKYKIDVAPKPVRDTEIFRILNEGSPYNEAFDNILQGFHILVLVGMLSSAYISMKNKNHKFLPLQISAFGLLLFLLLWEANSRYLMNYYPILIVSGILATFYFSFNREINVYKIRRR